MSANKNHAELGYRTLLVHAQNVGMGSSANDMEGVIVDLLTSIMHLNQEGYNLNIDNMICMAKERFKAAQSALDIKVVSPIKEQTNEEARVQRGEYMDRKVPMAIFTAPEEWDLLPGTIVISPKENTNFVMSTFGTVVEAQIFAKQNGLNADEFGEYPGPSYFASGVMGVSADEPEAIALGLLQEGGTFYQLQKNDELGLFESDEQAIEAALSAEAKGDPYAIEQLALASTDPLLFKIRQKQVAHAASQML